jgi:hypothetical protein
MKRVGYRNYIRYFVPGFYGPAPADPKNCLMCGGLLKTEELEISKHGARVVQDPAFMPSHAFTRLFSCKTCRWWFVREYINLFEVGGDSDVIFSGVARHWNCQTLQTRMALLKAHFANNSLKEKLLDHAGIEAAIIECLNRNYHSCEAKLIGVSDNADYCRRSVFYIKDEAEWLLQVQWGERGAVQSIHVIEYLNGLLPREENRCAILVTNANPFAIANDRIKGAGREIPPIANALTAKIAGVFSNLKPLLKKGRKEFGSKLSSSSPNTLRLLLKEMINDSATNIELWIDELISSLQEECEEIDKWLEPLSDGKSKDGDAESFRPVDRAFLLEMLENTPDDQIKFWIKPLQEALDYNRESYIISVTDSETVQGMLEKPSVQPWRPILYNCEHADIDCLCFPEIYSSLFNQDEKRREWPRLLFNLRSGLIDKYYPA